MEKIITNYCATPGSLGRTASIRRSWHTACIWRCAGREKALVPLNHNAGILYAKATQREDGTLHAKSLKNPWLFQMADGAFGILAVRMEADGSEDEESRGKLLLFTSKDLVRYHEEELLDLNTGVYVEDAVCRYDADKGCYCLRWKDAQGGCFAYNLPELSGEAVKAAQPRGWRLAQCLRSGSPAGLRGSSGRGKASQYYFHRGRNGREAAV